MSRKVTAKISFKPGKAKTNSNQIREWTTLNYQRECEAAVQSVYDASNDEDDDYFQYYGSIPQHFGFREDAQTRMESLQLHHPYNSRRPSSDENSVIGGTHQPTRFMIEEAQVQQQHKLLNTRVQDVPMIEVLQEKPGIHQEEESIFNWYGEETDMQTYMESNYITDIMEQDLNLFTQEQQVPQDDTICARPLSRKQRVPKKLKKKKAAKQLSSIAKIVNPTDINLNAITADSSDLLNSSKTYYGQAQSDQFYQSDLHAEKLKKEKEIRDLVDCIIAEETIKLQNGLGEKKRRGRPKGRQNKSVSEISNTHQQELNQEDSTSIIQQQHPALCRALREPLKLNQEDSRCIFQNRQGENKRRGRPIGGRNKSVSEILNTHQQEVNQEDSRSIIQQQHPALCRALREPLKPRQLTDRQQAAPIPQNYQQISHVESPYHQMANNGCNEYDYPLQQQMISSLYFQINGHHSRLQGYGRQQATPIPQDYQQIPHLERPYHQMANNGCDKYVYPLQQQMHMQLPTYGNNQHPPTVFPGYPFPDSPHPSPFPSQFVPHPPGQMPFAPTTSFHEVPTSRLGLQLQMAHL